MRLKLSSERGVTLTEILVVSSLFLVVLTATLTSAASFQGLNTETQKLNDQVDRARRGMDRTVRQLRNLARRIDSPVVMRAEASDFIFQTSDPARTWVRNCLQTQPDGTVHLWAMSAPGAVTSAMSAPCPGTGWARRDRLATNVTNHALDRNLPLFTYGYVQATRSTCTGTEPPPQADLTRINVVRMDLLLDDDLTRKPTEARVSSGVFLRNQNEPPVACFNWRPQSTRQILLNASASFDPEGRTLRFMWFRAPAPSFTCDQNPPSGSILWQGVTLPHTFLPTEGAVGAVRSIELVVCDPGDLQSRAVQQVTIP